MGSWVGPFGPAGAVQNKATDAALAAKMTFTAALGHACGRDFKAADLLQAHPEYDWQKPVLNDLPSRPWTRFSIMK